MNWQIHGYHIHIPSNWDGAENQGKRVSQSAPASRSSFARHFVWSGQRTGGLAVFILISIAVLLRLYHFTPPSTLSAYNINPVVQLPPGLHSDEAFNALGGLRIMRTGQVTAYSALDEGRSTLHMTMTALVIGLLLQIGL